MESVSIQQEPSKDEKRRSQPAKQSKPNYNALHADPLPVRVHPLPPLVPHNPLSLLHIAYTYISYLMHSSRSHPPVRYQGWLSLETRSVHVIDEKDIRALWEKGFFGKGNLSRSEPSWLDREKRRKGLITGITSEEVTKRRRQERRVFKKERAIKEREAIEEKLREETEPGRSDHHAPQTLDRESTSDRSVSLVATASRNHISTKPASTCGQVQVEALTRNETKQLEVEQSPTPSSEPILNNNDLRVDHIKDEEHLQLSFEEALFLVYGLGVLNIKDQNTCEPIRTDSLFTLFRQYSCFPPCEQEELQPDDPFLVSYVVYHHFRSLGWVVRSGVKFAVDYLLYNRGPVFSHAEFALMIIPSYVHPYWKSTEERATRTNKKENRSWWWLHCVNRVQTQVRKSLVLVYVEVPPPSDMIDTSPSRCQTNKMKPTLDIGQLLKRYRVRELALKRWIPNRSRD